MGWIDECQGKVVGLDTTPLIYFVEENPAYLETVRPFFEALDHGQFRVVTSVVTLLEVLVYPIRHGNVELAQQYRDILLNARHLTTVPLVPEVAEEAARLRAAHNIRSRMLFSWLRQSTKELRFSSRMTPAYPFYQR